MVYLTKVKIAIICLLSIICSVEVGKATDIVRADNISSQELEKLQVENSNSQSATVLEQQAQQLYENGQFEQAISLLQEAINDYAAQGDVIGQVIAIRNLALIYEHQGEWEKGKGAIAQSLKLLPEIADSRERQRLLAQNLEVQGQLELSQGKAEEALESWEEATKIYQEIDDIDGFARGEINQAQALQTLGLHNRATKTLSSLEEIIEAEADTLLKQHALKSLGDVLRRVGKLEQSESTLQESLVLAEKLQVPRAIADTLISLGNTARSQQKTELALELYQRVVQQSPSSELQIHGQLNQLSLLIEQKQWVKARPLIPQIQTNLSQLPLSRSTINARINLAYNLMQFENFQQSNLKIKTSELLATAIQQAKNLGDKRAQSYAIGSLGSLYEQSERYLEAKTLTEEAIIIAQGINAVDLAYQWQWQLGRILREQGDHRGAISAHTQSIKALKSLRSDLVAISSDIQFSFRETVEPVYRELVELLLRPPQNAQGEVSQEDLKLAREVIESLQLAELDNFFRDACLDAQPTQIDQLDPTAAVFYPIILQNHLEVIVALPGKPLTHYSTELPQEEIERTLTQARSLITNSRRPIPFQLLQQLHEWLISPIEEELIANNIKTLVFVPDGSLRNIPIATLYDGEKYIAQKYSVAIAPSLQLVDPKPLAREELKLLAAGLSESRQGFSALPGVEEELENIQSEVTSEVLLNDLFTETNFTQVVNDFPYPVVHLATHGEFSSKAEDTFVLTWDGRINIDELNVLLRADRQQTQPIELLVLSACKTAVGDKRAVLGLAGIAVRAGARSTMASLWSVNDEATSLLMTRFYQELTTSNVTKAEALRRSQEKLLQSDNFAHPSYWSAFMLVGNWL